MPEVASAGNKNSGTHTITAFRGDAEVSGNPARKKAVVDIDTKRNYERYSQEHN